MSYDDSNDCYAFSGNTSDQFKVHDLNVEAEPTQDDEDENDWEDG